MLEPNLSDIPFLFIVFIVVPLVSYFLLGKWSELTNSKKEEVSVIDCGATEGAPQVDDMAVGSVSPVIHLPNAGIRQCAKCLRPATTRCSKCKSVWYCSGRCQIAHWRLIHKLECQQLGEDSQTPSVQQISHEGNGWVPYAEATEQLAPNYNMQQQIFDNASSGDIVSTPLAALGNSDIFVFNSSEEVAVNGFSPPDSSQPLKNTYLGEVDFSLPEQHANSDHVSKNGDDDTSGALPESDVAERECLNAFDGGNDNGILNLSTIAISGTNAHETRTDSINGDYSSAQMIPCTEATKGLNDTSERPPTKRSGKSRLTTLANGTGLPKYPKSRTNVSKEPLPSDTDVKVQTVEESSASGLATLNDDIALQENNGVANMMLVSMTKSTQVERHQQLENSTIRRRKTKMIFPYEDFVKWFQYDGFNVRPNGLVNCGNTCYANAILQCLTCTKPLIIYLLRRSHSKAGCSKDWCLICELEDFVILLRQSEGPLSPLNILVYIRGLNTQIGDGSEEDAHEFLRLLLASMQSIYLEGYGGENVVDPKLQDTTFIQHTFGGCLTSKIKCLTCHHESERDEKMMDLTLEIFGSVESLEDALTQFTSPEDLDGDNMYRCASCSAYVPARKQLNIKEAPNILTIVLKRFQEGNYGKIDKCITFPEKLDMLPYMTGTEDTPPLYTLYGVVVHLEMSNASFSGHYISYVRDLQDNWYKVDDTEVQPVEVDQVLSEEAYILFYMRSYPRAVKCNMKAARRPIPGSTKRIINPGEAADISKAVLIKENKTRPLALKNHAETSEPVSSDFSHFTSSDDSSFTTDSTRDSFSSTVENGDVPVSSVVQSLCPAESTPRKSKGQTRFARQDSGLVQSAAADTTGFLNSGSEAIKETPQTLIIAPCEM